MKVVSCVRGEGKSGYVGFPLNERGFLVNQHKYTQDLIAMARLSDQKIADTPLELNVKYGKDDDELLENPTLYRRLVGSLVYLTMTRPCSLVLFLQFESLSNYTIGHRLIVGSAASQSAHHKPRQQK
jgi:hypothetical protein